MEKLKDLVKQNKLSQTTPKPLTESLPVLSKRSSELLKICQTGGEFLKEFNFDNCLKRYSDFKTEELALKSNKLKLREIAAIYNEQTPVSLIELWLFNMSKFMGWEVADQQIRETAIYIYEDNSFLNLTEITLFFKKLKKGIYGTFYGKFDGLKICSAVREYRLQRGQIYSRMPESEQNQLAK